MGEKEITHHVLETYGVTHRRIYHIKHSESKLETKEENLQYQSLTSFFFNAFLPHGYPDSVSKDYVQYQIWDSVQAFASSITGSICTHAVLKGVGVGDENASAIAATVTWLLKDGMSMIGRIGFAWLQGATMARCRTHGQSIASSIPDSTEDPLCRGHVKLCGSGPSPPVGVVWKFREGCHLGCPPHHLAEAQNFIVCPNIALV